MLLVKVSLAVLEVVGMFVVAMAGQYLLRDKQRAEESKTAGPYRTPAQRDEYPVETPPPMTVTEARTFVTSELFDALAGMKEIAIAHAHSEQRRLREVKPPPPAEDMPKDNQKVRT